MGFRVAKSKKRDLINSDLTSSQSRWKQVQLLNQIPLRFYFFSTLATFVASVERLTFTGLKFTIDRFEDGTQVCFLVLFFNGVGRDASFVGGILPVEKYNQNMNEIFHNILFLVAGLGSLFTAFVVLEVEPEPDEKV